MNEKKCALISYLAIGLLLLLAQFSQAVTMLLVPILLPIGIVCLITAFIIRARRTIKWLKSDDNETK